MKIHHRRRGVLTGAAVMALTGMAVAGCGGSSFSSNTPPPQQSAGPANLTILFGSSGPAETKNLQQLASTWAGKNNAKVTVTAAQDLSQQLAQGFASGSPADVFYVDPTKFETYVKAGDLYAYGDQLTNVSDFYPDLVKTYTTGGKLYCAPKDFSTLALQINDADWKAAGLTAADYPTTWAQLATAARKLTTGGRAGLVVSATHDRLGAFMQEAGGWYINPDGTKATADSAANVAALQYVQKLMAAGSMKYPAAVGAGWGGEAFGKNKAAMTIEGNWVASAMQADYPKVSYTVVPLPAGPSGKGTLSFSNCWGIAAKSANRSAAVKLVNFLASPDSELSISAEVGTIPARQSAAATYRQKYPKSAAYVSQGDVAHGPVTIAGMTDVLTAFDTAIEKLPAGSPKNMLTALHKNTQAALSSASTG